MLFQHLLCKIEKSTYSETISSQVLTHFQFLAGSKTAADIPRDTSKLFWRGNKALLVVSLEICAQKNLHLSLCKSIQKVGQIVFCFSYLLSSLCSCGHNLFLRSIKMFETVQIMPIEKNNNILKYFINTALMVCISKLAWAYINQNICLIYNSFQLIRPQTSLFVSLCRFSGFCFYLIFILRRTVLSRQANRKSLQLKLQSWQDP